MNKFSCLWSNCYLKEPNALNSAVEGANAAVQGDRGLLPDALGRLSGDGLRPYGDSSAYQAASAEDFQSIAPVMSGFAPAGTAKPFLSDNRDLDWSKHYHLRKAPLVSEAAPPPVSPAPAPIPSPVAQKAGDKRQAAKDGNKTIINDGVRFTGPAPKNEAYSIIFQVMDTPSPDAPEGAKSKPCAKTSHTKTVTVKGKTKTKIIESPGMYYTVYVPADDKFITGELDEHGRSERVTSQHKDAKAYFYIGRRIKGKDPLPLSRASAEDEQNEAPLNIKAVEQTLQKTSEDDREEFKDLVTLTTKRQWKPWTFSQKGEEYQIGQEGVILNPYGDGNDFNKSFATVGIGHLIHVTLQEKPRFPGVVLNDNLIEKVARQVKCVNNKELTYQNMQEALTEKLTGLGEKDLIRAHDEMRFVNQLTWDGPGGVLDIYHKDRDFNAGLIPYDINVPLYQYEYDTLVDLCFNGGRGDLRHKVIYLQYGSEPVSIQDILNAGFYSEVPAIIKLYGDHNYTSRSTPQKELWDGHYTYKRYDKNQEFAIRKSKENGTKEAKKYWTPLNKRNISCPHS